MQDCTDIFIGKKQTYEKTIDGPMKRLYLDFVCKQSVELKSSPNIFELKTFLKFWVQLKSFAKKLSRVRVQNVLNSS